MNLSLKHHNEVVLLEKINQMGGMQRLVFLSICRYYSFYFHTIGVALQMAVLGSQLVNNFGSD